MYSIVSDGSFVVVRASYRIDWQQSNREAANGVKKLWQDLFAPIQSPLANSRR